MTVTPSLTASLRRDWNLLSTAVFLFAFGFAIYGAAITNFISGPESPLKLDALHVGGLESLREIPGLLAVGIAGLVAAYSETKIGAICLILSAFGIAATGFVHSYVPLIGATVFWSVFMHQWFTSSSAIPLALAKGQEGGRHLGRMGAIGAGATMLAFVLISPLSRVFHDYRVFFVASGCFIFAAGVALLPMSGHGNTRNRPRLLYRRQYGLYYGLSLLEGFRRQIFSTFAILALVNHYHVPLPQVAALMLINSIVTFFVASPVGKMVDRVGERPMMAFYYSAIAIAFAGYALSGQVLILEILYVIDNALFSFGVSITTYLNRIVRPGELMPTLAMGQTMNHIAAVAIPIAGGLLWARFGYHAPFWAGVIAALISLSLTRLVSDRPVAAVALPVS